MGRKLVWLLVIVAGVIFSYWLGGREGTEMGARQMARHILNPAFETESFYSIMNEECGSDKGWGEMNGCLVFYKEGVTIDGRYLSPEERKYFTPIDPNGKAG